MIALAPRTVQNMPDRLRREPMTVPIANRIFGRECWHIRPAKQMLVPRFSSNGEARDIHAEIDDRKGSCRVGQRELATSVPRQERGDDCYIQAARRSYRW